MSKANKPSKVLRVGLERFQKSLDANGGQLAKTFFAPKFNPASGKKAPHNMFCARGVLTGGLGSTQTDAQRLAQEYLAVAMYENGGAKALKRGDGTGFETLDDHYVLVKLPPPDAPHSGDPMSRYSSQQRAALCSRVPRMHDSAMTPEQVLAALKIALIRAEADETEERLAKRGL